MAGADDRRDPFQGARSLHMFADERLPLEEFPQSLARMTRRPGDSGKPYSTRP